jgi:hypothetical protein
MPQQYDRGLRHVSTPSDWASYERTARDTVADMLVAADQSITSKQSVHARPIIPQWDLDAGADSGWNGTDAIWTQNSSGATSAGDEVEVYNLDSDNGLDGKTAIIFGFRHLGGGSVTDDVSQVAIRNTTGGTIEQYDLSQLDVAAEEDYRALIENPIRLDLNKSADVVFIAQSDLSSNDPELQLMGAVADDEGEDLESSDRFVAN